MQLDTYLQIAFLLTLAGVAFSGYLSAVRLLAKKCAFNESCPYFLGVPACWVGFIFFSALFGVSAAATLGYLPPENLPRIMLGVASAAVLFSGYITLGDLLARPRRNNALGLPTCAYGFVMFLAIWGFSFVALGAPLF